MDNRALLALGGLGLLVLVLQQQDGAMTVAQLADYLRAKLPDEAKPWADEIARGTVDTCPADFVDPAAADDRGAALRRWVLDVAAVGDHESGYGTFRGYFPRPGDAGADPTGWGDAGHAFGFWQLDKRYHWSFIQSSEAQTVEGQARYAAGLLAGNWRAFAARARDERERLMFITYNASLSRIRTLLADGGSVDDADNTTTKRRDVPYGQSVLDVVSQWS